MIVISVIANFVNRWLHKLIIKKKRVTSGSVYFYSLILKVLLNSFSNNISLHVMCIN